MNVFGEVQDQEDGDGGGWEGRTQEDKRHQIIKNLFSTMERAPTEKQHSTFTSGRSELGFFYT